MRIPKRALWLLAPALCYFLALYAACQQLWGAVVLLLLVGTLVGRIVNAVLHACPAPAVVNGHDLVSERLLKAYEDMAKRPYGPSVNDIALPKQASEKRTQPADAPGVDEVPGNTVANAFNPWANPSDN